ncbi:NrsF family protein [Chelatococcus sp. SYSU_G07232]|uniref:NrsF family protein n=1 Tax=Chelatococcus albus TaxID=3047466 RepID=A0ABT7AEZ5_9HYPH|nr:NrsF family protein [Chelatococcus sp. SYSU_G07232]MDJ1157932.1 NrsF family protein [Chelatococcus sp. SYSU_G07232]
MKTTQLIDALVQDQATRSPPVATVCAVALVPAVVTATVLFMMALGPRPDIAAAAETPRFLFKFVVAFGLTVTALALLPRLAQPGRDLRGRGRVLLLAPLLLAGAVATELILLPAAEWWPRLVGRNLAVCLVSIPALSLAPLAALLVALRHGAPTAPGVAGAVAGLAAGGIGATLYAAHCTDDSPLFVATWYTLAVALVVVAGAAIGRRVLRW